MNPGGFKVVLSLAQQRWGTLLKGKSGLMQGCGPAFLMGCFLLDKMGPGSSEQDVSCLSHTEPYERHMQLPGIIVSLKDLLTFSRGYACL